MSGPNPDNHYSVLVCVERRKTAVVVLEGDGTLALLGDRILVETFQMARELGLVKSSDIGERLSLSPQNANNRLKRFAGAGALRKMQVTGSSRGGKEFLYETVGSEMPDPCPLTPA